MPNLFSLFDNGLISRGDLVASDPMTLDDISTVSEEQEFALHKIKELETVDLKVDYSDFSNFIFFNSAYDYFNITGEKIINEYPIAGSKSDLAAFTRDLDGYQKYLLKTWPKSVGHLKFSPASGYAFVKVDDVGVDDGHVRSGLLSVGSSSLSIEFWLNPATTLTGTEDFTPIVQKQTESPFAKGYRVYLTGSKVYADFMSGSQTATVSCDYRQDTNQYFSFVFNRTSLGSGTLAVYTGSSQEFPVFVSSASFFNIGTIDNPSDAFYMMSGTLGSKVQRPFNGKIDDVAVWRTSIDLTQMTSSFNVKRFVQQDLYALWRFNETGSLGSSNPLTYIVNDSSGHRLNGRISGYYSSIRASGTLMTSEDPDPVLLVDAPEVTSLIVQQQQSGSDFDKSNSNHVTNLFPEEFFRLEDELQTNVLKNFLYIIARQMDRMKLYADQFVNLFRSNYGEFDQTPDALLGAAAQYYGWEFTGNFLSADTFQYILGRNVLSNLDSNKDLEKKLFEIKNQFWKRVLINLMHVYKTKGTRESVGSLFRSYGVNENFVRLKEFSSAKNTFVEKRRIQSDKSVSTLVFGLSGSVTASLRVSENSNFNVLRFISGSDHSIEMRVRFPLTSSVDAPTSIPSGTLWWHGSGTGAFYSLVYERDSISSQTGSIILTSSLGKLAELTGAVIFDNRWQNIAMTQDTSRNEICLKTFCVQNGDVYSNYSSSSFINNNFYEFHNGLLTQSITFIVGAPRALSVPKYEYAQYTAQEARIWKIRLSDDEIKEHAMNFQNYGVRDPITNSNKLLARWKIDDNVSASFAATDATQFTVQNYALTGSVAASGTNFYPGMSHFRKYLLEYDYISSLDFGWTQDKVRIIDHHTVNPGDVYHDERYVTLEFNMIDALNEDIVQIMPSLEDLNDILGNPTNAYDHKYYDLEKMKDLYFKRLQGRLNFRVFSDFLEFFDRSFVTMVRRLIPASAQFNGDEFVVESHMLERPKLQFQKKRQEKPFSLEGVISLRRNDTYFTRVKVENTQKPIDAGISGLVKRIDRSRRS